MTTVVGLDLSLTSAGIAGLTTNTEARPGILWPAVLECVGRDGHKGEDYRRRNRRVRAQTGKVIAALDRLGPIDLVAIEGPIYAGNVKPSYFDRAALFHFVYGALDARNIPIAVIPPTTGHVFTTGVGSLPKDPKRLKALIVESMRATVPDIRLGANDDLADALGLAFMAGMARGAKLPFLPRQRHYNAVYTATWPKGEEPPRWVNG